nr:reverse transcriptase domain-containing protein [Tanacetum cinerariifolium]
LADLGASINLMPLSVWKKLSLPELNPTQMILELADWSTTRPTGIAEDVFEKVGKFHFPADFVVVDYVVDPQLTLHVSDEAITFKVGNTSRYSYNDAESINRIDVIDIACEEYSQVVLGFSDNSKSGNPTPISEPIISNSSPSLTPFEGGDFILKEIESYLASDSVPPGINDADFDPEGDIRLIEEILNNDPTSPCAQDCKVPVAETFHEQTDEELTEKEIKQMEEDDQAIQTILMGVPEDIYAAVDSYETAQEIWLRDLDEIKKVNANCILMANLQQALTSLPVCYDDDDDEDEERSNSLKDNIIFGLPPCAAITPNEPINSLSMGDEHLNTISATESNEFIKSCVENLVPNPSESKGENCCDVPACFTTFSNVLFVADYEFDSVNDQSLSDEDFLEKIFSNPLFEEEIIPMKIDHHHFNAESDLIESLLNHDSFIIHSSSKIDSLLDEFAGELTLLKSIPSGIDEIDCDPENEIYLIERLLYDNSSPRLPEEFVSENSDAEIESFSPSPIPVKDSDSFMEEIDLSFTPDDPMPSGIE